MPKLVLTFCLVVLSVQLMPAQAKVYTFIQENSVVYENSEFYIQKIIDARGNKETLGQIYSTDKRKKYTADFNRTLSNEFADFFKHTFPQGKHKHKVILVVDSFSIDHQLGEGTKDIGSAEMNASFYLNRNDTCFYLTSSSKRISETAKDVQITHPNRIKRLLLLSAAQMIDSLKKFASNPPVAGMRMTTLDELKKSSISKDVQRRRAKQHENTLPEFYMFNLGTYYGFSKPVVQFGITGNLVLQVKKAPKYLIGISGNLMLYGTPSDDIQVPLFTSFEVFNYDLGIKLLKQVKNNFFLNFNPQVNLGYIKEVNSSERKNILGFQMDAGVYLIPPANEGVYSGLNLFYRTTNTEFFGASFGLKLDLGYRF
jgi:hypothetical protein